MKYNCQKCKKDCNLQYGDRTKKLWICEKCWEEEIKEDGGEIEEIDDDE